MKRAYAITVGVVAAASVTILNYSVLSNQLHQKFILDGIARSQNWSGYIDKTNRSPYTDITGSWTVPNVTGSNQSANAQWIGLGGVLSHDLLQMGTLETIQNGQQVDELFWEKLPKVAAPIADVQPGDKINTEIKHLEGNTWQLIAKISNGSKTITKNVDVSLNSRYTNQIEQTAEWISEDPENGDHKIMLMAEAGKVTFTDATVNNNSISQVNASTLKTVLIDSPNGEVVVPTKLRNNGTSFSTLPESQLNVPKNIQVDLGTTLPLNIPLQNNVIGDNSFTQMWNQIAQMNSQINHMIEQWTKTAQVQSVQGIPWTEQLDFGSNNNSKIQTWFGDTDSWHWTVHVVNY